MNYVLERNIAPDVDEEPTTASSVERVAVPIASTSVESDGTSKVPTEEKSANASLKECGSVTANSIEPDAIRTVVEGGSSNAIPEEEEPAAASSVKADAFLTVPAAVKVLNESEKRRRVRVRKRKPRWTESRMV
jgi:hypothetical protein